MFRCTLNILGKAGLFCPDGGAEALSPGKPFALLCLIALEERLVTRPAAAALLWPDSPTEKQLASVRQALWTIKKAAGRSIVDQDGSGTLTIDRAAVALDLDELARAIREGDGDGVIALWARGPLDGVVIPGAPAWNQWASELHARWERRVGEFFERQAATRALADRPRWTEHAVQVRPHRAGAHALHVRALLDVGRFAEAREALARGRYRCRGSQEADEELSPDPAGRRDAGIVASMVLG